MQYRVVLCLYIVQ